jgi:hypothetical protein
VACFSEESKEELSELVELWIAHLSENIFSVRHHSAKAIATVFESASMFREELEKKITSHLNANILKIQLSLEETTLEFMNALYGPA